MMHNTVLLSSLLLGLATTATSSLFRFSPREQVCNGRAAFCDRKYSNVSLIGAHDSAFVGPILDPRVNQEKNVTQQLDAGIRFLEGQTHVLNGVLSMCHTSCLELYAGSLETYLTTIKDWLDANPNDVVSVLIANGDYVNVTMFADVFETVGLDKLAFIPSTSPNMLPRDEWPTYGEMIAAGKRLVVWLDYDANESEVPYILEEFNYYFETPYDTTDPTFPQCSIDRPSGGDPATLMSIVNHFLDTNLLGTGILIPDDAADYTTNAATGNGSIGAQAALCESLYGRPPNVVFVDMFDRGDVFAAQAALNGFAS